MLSILSRVKNRLRPKSKTEAPTTDHLSAELLRGAIGGWLETGNLKAIDNAFRKLPQGAIIEIGLFTGLSTVIMANARQYHSLQNPFFNCDKWEYDGGDCYNLKSNDYMNFVFESYKRNVQTFAPELPRTVKAFSDEFFELWEKGATVTDVWGREQRLGGAIAFAFIDGNHDYDFARRDFENVDKHLAKGGYILFDDSGKNSQWGVARLMKEIPYEFIDANPNYLFKKA